MQGYFYSRNCLREVRATVEYGKPVVFVHEEDEARGGAPVEELALQCPADHRRYLFESHFKIIPCSRMLNVPSWWCHRLLLRPPGTHSPGSGLLYSL